MAHLNNLLALVDKKLTEREIVEMPVNVLNESEYVVTEFGRSFLQNFHLDDSIYFLNHGSYGALLKCVLAAQMRWTLHCSLNPIQFLSNHVVNYLCSTVVKLSEFVKSNPEDLVLVPNVTSAVSTVLSCIQFSAEDNIVYPKFTYQAVGFALEHTSKRTGCKLKCFDVDIPMSIEKYVADFENAIDANTKLCVVDHINSPFAFIFPLERLIEIAHRKGAMILVDGAHAVGQITLDLNALQPDFYTSNCHKWLYSAQGSAFLWVKKAHQHLIYPNTISHGYRDTFASRFIFTGTMDYSAYLSINTALAFRERIEEKLGVSIMKHNSDLAMKAALYLRDLWKTKFCLVDEDFNSRPHGSIITVFLPPTEGVTGFAGKTKAKLREFLADEILRAYRIEVPIVAWKEDLMVRISGQIYTEMSDYNKLGEAILKMFELQ